MWRGVPGRGLSSRSFIIVVDVQNHPHQSLAGPDTAHHPPPARVLPLHELVPEPGGRTEGAEGEVLDNLRSELCLVAFFKTNKCFFLS